MNVRSKYPVEGYGEVKDLVDKIKLYSNLRIHAYEQGLPAYDQEGNEIRHESDEVLEQIEKDLNELVFTCIDGGWI